MSIERHTIHTPARARVRTLIIKMKKEMAVMQDLVLTACPPSGGTAVLTSVESSLAFFRSALRVDDTVPLFLLWSLSILPALSAHAA